MGELNLTAQDKAALQILKYRIIRDFPVEGLILFGSVVRDENDHESDIDIAVITTYPLNRSERHGITDLVFEVNLEYGSNISTLVVDKDSWESGPISQMPISKEIRREGIAL